MTVANHEVEIVDAFNDELGAQDNFLNKIAELSREDAKSSIIYECLMVSKTKCNISQRCAGWTYSTKRLHQIVCLHNVKQHSIIDTD